MNRHMLIAFFAAAGILADQFPAGAQTFFTYRCRDGSEFIAAFYEGDSRAARWKSHNASKAYIHVGITLRERRHYTRDYKDGHHA